MKNLKMFLKITGLIMAVLLVVLVWFWGGSLIVGLILNTESNMACFALVLLMWWYLTTSIKLVKITTKHIELTYE